MTFFLQAENDFHIFGSMRTATLTLLFVVSANLFSFAQNNDSIPSKNRQVLEYVTKHGRKISPTYKSAVCTELVIGVLSHFIRVTEKDKSNVRIVISENVYELMASGSPLPKGVYHALTSNGTGIPIDDWSQVLPGDFVQFWYPNSWGHCGIVHSIDLENKTMELHSSFPSTKGYGIQQFNIPEYCYFVRLK